MNAKEILEIIENATTNNGFISIKRYRSESGRIADVILQPLGPKGYHRLIAESIEQVERGDIEKPSMVEQSVWDEAIVSQLESWKKSLSDEGHGREDNFHKEAKGFYTHENNGDVVTIRNVRIIKKNVIVEGEYASTKSRPLTIAKKLLVAQTPISSYQGSYKLDPAKFDRLRFNRTEIETD